MAVVVSALLAPHVNLFPNLKTHVNKAFFHVPIVIAGYLSEVNH
jgi:hypothetical protein